MRHLDSASLFLFFIPPGGFAFPAVVWYILSGRATGRRPMMYIPRKNCKINGNTFLPLCRVMPSWASAEEKTGSSVKCVDAYHAMHIVLM